MFLSFDDINLVKDNENWLRQYIDLHNKVEEAYDDLHTIINDFFNDYAREGDYDKEEYENVIEACKCAEDDFKDFMDRLHEYSNL